MGRGHTVPAGWMLQTGQNKCKEHQKGFKGKECNDGVSLQETALCRAGCHEACTKLLPENLGDGSSAESEVIDQVETSRGSGEEVGEGRMCPYKEQLK